jgi:tetratricopeptide (TPR) repeat protein
MDALRKAEEAKKKAEQGDSDKPEQKAAEQESATEEASPESELVAEPSSADDPAEESRSIPNVNLEFEPEPELQSSAEIPTGETAAPAKKEASSASKGGTGDLALEPIDEGLSQATRKHFDVDVTPDYSAELSGHPPAKAESEDSAEQSRAEADSTEQIPTLQQSEEAGADEDAASAANSEKQEQAEADAQAPASDELPEYVPQEPEPLPAKPEKATARSASGLKLRLSPKQSTIRDRTESDRRGAQSLFAAKHQGKWSRVRIRRSTRIWAAQIAIGLMLMVGAYFYFFVINTSTDSFNVPEEYLVNQELFSEDFNENFAALDSPVETEELLPLEEQLAAQDLEFEILNEPTADAGLDAVLTDVIEEESVQIAEQQPAPTPIAEIAVERGVDVAVTEEVLEEPPESPLEIATAVPTDTSAIDSGGDDVATLETMESPGAPIAATQPTQLVSSQGTTNSISFLRTQATPSIDPVLRDAYLAFQRDNLVVAQDLYQRVLAESPRNRDALLGLAAIANRNGETVLAMELYSRLLARDPSDPVARAGLLGLRPVGRPEQQERELRRLLELQPQVAPVAYALGNFYAAEDRWRDAQRYYFDALQQAKTDALQGVPVNPDYAFNLAVSLEHLNESALAETYYREAIAYAAEFPAGFDVSIARERLISLAEVSAR